MSETTLHPLEAILRLCAQAAPAPWFPKAYAQAAGVPVDDLLYLLEHLWLEGLIQKAGGSREAGPGFVLTPEGEQILRDPSLLEQLRTGSVRTPGDRGATVRDAIRNPPRPLMSRALLTANLLVFAYGLYLAWPKPALFRAFLSGPWFARALPAMPRVQQILHEIGALRGDDLIQGQWWRLLSCGFVHIGLLHLGMNMYALYVMGWQSEAMWGRWRFLLIYLAGLLGGSCAMVAGHPTALGAGASGALCGLLASEAVWLFANRRYFPMVLVKRWRSGLTTSLILLVVISLAPGVSGWAHLGGALSGGAAAWLLNIQRFTSAPMSWLALVGLIPVFGAGFLAIDQARTTQIPWHKLEEVDFARRLLGPAKQAMDRADRVYNNQVLTLLERHPNRRDPDAVTAARKALDEQATAIGSRRESALRTSPYYQADLEQKRENLIAALDAESAIFTRAGECLEKAAACTAQDEKALQLAVEKAEADWKKLFQ